MTASFATSGTDDHPEVTEISALTEGLLPPERTADVQSHLAGCVLCADVRSSLEEIRATLGTLPGPVRMPEDVAGRIDAALAAEALLDSTPVSAAAATADQEPVGSPEPVAAAAAADAPADTAPPVSRETTGTRAGEIRRTRPPARPAGATGPGRSRTPRRRHRTLLAVTGACAALVVGGLFVPSLFTDGDSDGADQATEQEAAGPGELEQQVQQLLAAAAKDEESRESGAKQPEGPDAQDERNEPDIGPRSSPPASPTAPLGAEGAVSVPSCVSAGIDRLEAPLAAARQSYQGTDSYLVVLPHSGDNSRVDAYVVDAGCVSASSDTPGTVLAEETVPRP